MHEFVDSYMESLSKESRSLNTVLAEEDKSSHSGLQERNFDVLSALCANQERQKRQRRIKCVEEIQIESLKREEPIETNKLRRHDRYSQSMIIPEAVTASKKLSKHRRTESRSFDSASLRKIMNIDLDLIEKMGNKK
eukprot:TRINITY_DN3868_c0_g5_i1.p2 TRINITY_DN3868_c0_g5~~TRINITY_DN3868_c0_g5_i1.p2  ORF type:complete len:137 (-),score=27.62 TRINITY_DN3868_c0_g5_i1:173-583(-)